MKKALVILAIIMIIAGIIIVSNGHYDFNQKKDVVDFLKSYGNWLIGLGKNVGNLTAYAIKLPWLPQ